MFFHSRNDSKYIAELRQALIQTGLQDKNPIKLEYKGSQFYNKALVYANKRIPKDRKDVVDIEDSIKNKVYRYTVKSNQGNVFDLMGENINNELNIESKISTFKFKDIDYNILIGAAERYNE